MKVRVNCLAVSLDGFAAGPSQDLENPLGVRGSEIFDWFLRTRTFRKMQGLDGGETGVEDTIAARSMEGVGAWIMGRNMFGPVRGAWPDESWRGWWGDEPPYHVPVFVLTHYERAPLTMAGGTEFRFITSGITEALGLAKAAAGEKDVRIGGGAATVREYLAAGLVDELHVALSPVLLGQGESLWNDLDMHALGYVCKDVIRGDRATHVMIGKTSS